MRQSVVKNAQRIVVKMGSWLVTNAGQGVDPQAVMDWTRQIATMQQTGKEVVLVSSGAIAEGVVRLGLKERPVELPLLQACAAVGQMGLAQAFEDGFEHFGLKTAQLLLTRSDLADRERYLNARETLSELLRLGVVPVINENDTVVTDEIKVGDNDTLASLVANLINADVLIILTDQRGMYTADPRKDPQAKFLDVVRAGDPALEKMAGGAASTMSKGGMITKVLAAKRAARSGTDTVVAWGREKDVLVRLSQGEHIGTEFVAEGKSLHSREKWIADQLRVEGRIYLDQGAAVALRQQKTSLLPIGVRGVQGEFRRGAVVSCLDPAGKEIARGIVNYSSQETARISGHHSAEITRILGYMTQPELIHRDNLVMLV